MISSIINLNFNSKIKYATIFLMVACSHSKIPNLTKNVNEVKSINLAPTNTSDIFQDVTEEYGLSNIKSVHNYAVDLNNDGFTDLVILEDYYSVPKFYYFNPKLKKFELGDNPFPELTRASFLNFVDLDHDGVYDVIVGSLNQKTEMSKKPPLIFKGEIVNNRIKFLKKGELPVGILPTSNISVLDYDLDGNLDLFIANWFDFSNGTPKIIPNILLKGDGFKFENVSNLLNKEYEKSKSTKDFSNIAPTFGATVCDIDQNGFPDILTNSSNGYYNKLWMNLDKNNERYFEDYGVISKYAADEDGAKEVKGGGNSFFSLCGDYNVDKIVDVVIGNLFQELDLETRDRSAVLTGTTLKFPPVFLRSEVYQADEKKSWSEGDRRGIFYDYNMDGLPDLLMENSGFPPDSRLIMFHQHEDHSYEDIAQKLGVNISNPSGVIVLDLDRDGVMDFIVGQTDIRAGQSPTRLYVFKNKVKRDNALTMRFHLQGKNSNTHGISSSIYLVTNTNRYFQNVQYNFGSLPSQNEEGIYYAIKNEIPIEVMVSWPFGTKDRLGRVVPELKHYDLKKLKLKPSTHHEFNLCEDGRVLERKINCY